jgi:hypothetical protein
MCCPFDNFFWCPGLVKSEIEHNAREVNSWKQETKEPSSDK